MNSMDKDWQRWLFFQMLKTTKHTKKQGNMAQPKEQTKAPETDPKETQIPQFPHTEFYKITLKR